MFSPFRTLLEITDEFVRLVHLGTEFDRQDVALTKHVNHKGKSRWTTADLRDIAACHGGTPAQTAFSKSNDFGPPSES